MRHWANSDEQVQAQPEHHRNRDSPRKDFLHVRDEFRLHPDGGERLFVRPLPLAQGVQEYGRSHRRKCGRVLVRADSTPGKKRDHMPQPGLEGPLSVSTALWRHH